MMHPRDNTRFSQGINKTTEMSTNPKPSETTTGTITATTKGGTSTTWGTTVTTGTGTATESLAAKRATTIRITTTTSTLARTETPTIIILSNQTKRATNGIVLRTLIPIRLKRRMLALIERLLSAVLTVLMSRFQRLRRR